jgi:hypothetical protein
VRRPCSARQRPFRFPTARARPRSEPRARRACRTALLLLATDDPDSTSAKPVMAAIIAGFGGAAHVAITGSRFVSRSD